MKNLSRNAFFLALLALASSSAQAAPHTLLEFVTAWHGSDDLYVTIDSEGAVRGGEGAPQDPALFTLPAVYVQDIEYAIGKLPAAGTAAAKLKLAVDKTKGNPARRLECDSIGNLIVKVWSAYRADGSKIELSSDDYCAAYSLPGDPGKGLRTILQKTDVAVHAYYDLASSIFDVSNRKKAYPAPSVTGPSPSPARK